MNKYVNLFFTKPEIRKLLNSHFPKHTIGELFIVVIGILIAFQLENCNSNRKARIEYENLLGEAKIELVENINNAFKAILLTRSKDSLASRVILNKSSSEDYVQYPDNYLSIITFHNQAILKSDAYNTLISHPVHQAEKYSELLRILRKVDNERKEAIEDGEIARSINLDFQKYLRNTQNWYSSIETKAQNNEEIIAFLNDNPHFPNYVRSYCLFSVKNAVGHYANYIYLASQAYVLICKLLSEKIEYDKISPNRSKSYFSELCGEYLLIRRSRNNMNQKDSDLQLLNVKPIEYNISENYGHLVLKNSSSSSPNEIPLIVINRDHIFAFNHYGNRIGKSMDFTIGVTTNRFLIKK